MGSNSYPLDAETAMTSQVAFMPQTPCRAGRIGILHESCDSEAERRLSLISLVASGEAATLLQNCSSLLDWRPPCSPGSGQPYFWGYKSSCWSR